MSVPEVGAGPVGQARQALWAALSDLLDDGRVQPYDDAVPQLPAITIGKHRLGSRSVGNPAANVTVATFPVVIRVDGTKLAQLRKLDELSIEVWRRCGDVKRLGRLARPIAGTPGVIDLLGSELPTQTQTHTIDAEIGIDPIAWCPAAPEQEQP